MTTMINGQLILEEEYDENYQPTEEGMRLKLGYTTVNRIIII